ncbi:hypothetical protein ACFLZ7_01770 [Nanoarchaeota archaeon]
MDIIRVKVKGPSNTNRGYTYAIDEVTGRNYFIANFGSSNYRGYVDIVRKNGNKVTLATGREVEEHKAKVEEEKKAKEIDDANSSPLYKLIEPVKREQIEQFGDRNKPDSYETKMLSLKQGKVEELLKEDAPARHVVSAILSIDEFMFPESQGCHPETKDTIRFTDYQDWHIFKRIDQLKEFGLLDDVKYHTGTGWCFNSELVYKPVEGEGNYSSTHAWRPGFYPNKGLRNALFGVMLPFEDCSAHVIEKGR